ncbi:MAG: hypothetical protein ABSB50_01600 [Terracidiphilus sp.]
MCNLVPCVYGVGIPGARTAYDQVLMYMVSLCVLQERFELSSGTMSDPLEAGVPAD